MNVLPACKKKKNIKVNGYLVAPLFNGAFIKKKKNIGIYNLYVPTWMGESLGDGKSAMVYEICYTEEIWEERFYFLRIGEPQYVLNYLAES